MTRLGACLVLACAASLLTGAPATGTPADSLHTTPTGTPVAGLLLPKRVKVILDFSNSVLA